MFLRQQESAERSAGKGRRGRRRAAAWQVCAVRQMRQMPPRPARCQHDSYLIFFSARVLRPKIFYTCRYVLRRGVGDAATLFAKECARRRERFFFFR